MSDHNEHNRPPAPQTRSERRERVKEYCRILQKVTHDLRSSITERDLRKILSAPIGKRDSNTNAVISQDILWEYLPRQHDGLTIDPFTASFILQDVADQAVRQKLREIPGLVLSSLYFIASFRF
ncbi:hypothetical protein DPV78_001449 [Talaromyces pinophilus]|nr:hypothetical protein DPV78_001449 [Talaromyces pinophilus]